MESITFNQDPTRVILLMDISGSIGGSNSYFELSFSVEIAEQLISYMAPNTEVGLGFFNKEFVSVLRPTADRKTLKDQLEALRGHPRSFRGKTALWDAIVESLKMFDRPHIGDAIYIITDGGDNASKIKMLQVAPALREVGVRLFAFVFQNGGLSHTEEEENGPDFLRQIVQDTGGTIVAKFGQSFGLPLTSHDPAFFDKSGQPTPIRSNLEAQFREMSTFYRAEIELPVNVDKPTGWTLDLTGLPKPQRVQLVLTYPHLLIPCH